MLSGAVAAGRGSGPRPAGLRDGQVDRGAGIGSRGRPRGAPPSGLIARRRPPTRAGRRSGRPGAAAAATWRRRRGARRRRRIVDGEMVAGDRRDTTDRHRVVGHGRRCRCRWSRSPSRRRRMTSTATMSRAEPAGGPLSPRSTRMNACAASDVSDGRARSRPLRLPEEHRELPPAAPAPRGGSRAAGAAGRSRAVQTASRRARPTSSRRHRAPVVGAATIRPSEAVTAMTGPLARRTREIPGAVHHRSGPPVATRRRSTVAASHAAAAVRIAARTIAAPAAARGQRIGGIGGMGLIRRRLRRGRRPRIDPDLDAPGAARRARPAHRTGRPTPGGASRPVRRDPSRRTCRSGDPGTSTAPNRSSDADEPYRPPVTTACGRPRATPAPSGRAGRPARADARSG